MMKLMKNVVVVNGVLGILCVLISSFLVMRYNSVIVLSFSSVV